MYERYHHRDREPEELEELRKRVAAFLADLTELTKRHGLWVTWGWSDYVSPSVELLELREPQEMIAWDVQWDEVSQCYKALDWYYNDIL